MCNKADGRPPYTVYPKSQSSKYFDGLDEVESGGDKKTRMKEWRLLAGYLGWYGTSRSYSRHTQIYHLVTPLVVLLFTRFVT
jgi:hypothetical protein